MFLNVEKEANEAFKAILGYLSSASNIKKLQQNEDGLYELSLRPLFESNLALVFKPVISGGGAKFSLRSDGIYTITIFVNYVGSKERWPQKLVANIREWFLTRHDSFIHEYVHYLDYGQAKEANAPDPYGDKASYYNHPAEFKAYLVQGLASLVYALEHMPSSQLLKLFGRGPQEVMQGALRYFDGDYLTYINADHRTLLINSVRQVYDEFALKESLRPLIRAMLAE